MLTIIYCGIARYVAQRFRPQPSMPRPEQGAHAGRVDDEEEIEQQPAQAPARFDLPHGPGRLGEESALHPLAASAGLLALLLAVLEICALISTAGEPPG